MSGFPVTINDRVVSRSEAVVDTAVHAFHHLELRSGLASWASTARPCPSGLPHNAQDRTQILPQSQAAEPRQQRARLRRQLFEDSNVAGFLAEREQQAKLKHLQKLDNCFEGEGHSKRASLMSEFSTGPVALGLGGNP